MPLASVIKVYVKNIFFGLIYQIFMLFSCENRKKKREKIPYLLSFLEFQMCKNVNFRFRLGTIPQKTEQRG